MGGIKDPAGKLRFDLVPASAPVSDAEAFTYGAGVHGERNWEKGIPYLQLYAAALRHLYKWRTGEDNDSESGLPHLAHARSNLAMLLDMPKEWDDRNTVKP